MAHPFAFKLLLFCWLLLLAGMAGPGRSSGASYDVAVISGYNLIGINVDTSAAATLDDMLGGDIPDGSLLFTWDENGQQYHPDNVYFAGLGWLDSMSFEPSRPVALGKGAYINIPFGLSLNLTITGAEPPANPNPVLIEPGRYYLLASQNLNNPGSYADIVGHNDPPAELTVLAKYVAGQQFPQSGILRPPNFIVYTYMNGQWMEDTGDGTPQPMAPQIARGEGVVIQGPQSIEILDQPVSITTNDCSPATFSVTTAPTAIPPQYQWERSTDDGATWTAIPLAYASSYTQDPVTAVDGGLYRVVVSIGFVSVQSEPARLTFVPSASIRGRVFNDADGNGQPGNDAEYGLPNWVIRLDSVPAGTPRFTTTDASGLYAFCVPAGSYSVSATPKANWARTAPATPAHAVMVNQGQEVTGLDFGFRATQAVQDLAVTLTAVYPFPLRSPCCGQEMTYRIAYRNAGTTAIQNPSVELVVSSSVTLLDFKTSPTSASLPWPANGTWVVPGTFVPGASGMLFVRARVNPCPVGETPAVIGTASIQLPFDDVPWNNTDSHVDQARCSMDPNDKLVSPRGCGELGLISRDQEFLTYLVLFQNMGTGPAYHVVIRDELDTDLDLASLETLGSSHPAVLHVEGRELVWTFWDIVLPPLSEDELGSQGYVKFRVRINADPAPGTRIENTAAIYFDLNDPVITSTTVNTIADVPVPSARFTGAVQPGSNGRVFDFTYTGGSEGVTFHWDFGPDAVPPTSTDPHPAGIAFPEDGKRMVVLHVDLAGCTSDPALQPLRIGRPGLDIQRRGSLLYLTWMGDGFGLEEAGAPDQPLPWTPVIEPIQSIGGANVVVRPVEGTPRFFRLRTE